jgi:hypothetical protein
MSGQPWLNPLSEDADEPPVAGNFTLDGRAELGRVAKLALEESAATAVGDLLSYEENGEA